MSSKKPTRPNFLASTLSLSVNRMDKKELVETLEFCKKIIDSLSSCTKKKSFYEEWRGKEQIILSYIFFLRSELKERFFYLDDNSTYLIDPDFIIDDFDLI